MAHAMQRRHGCHNDLWYPHIPDSIHPLGTSICTVQNSTGGLLSERGHVPFRIDGVHSGMTDWGCFSEECVVYSVFDFGTNAATGGRIGFAHLGTGGLNNGADAGVGVGRGRMTGSILVVLSVMYTML